MTRLLKSAGDLVRPGQANKTPGATPLYLVWDFIVCRTLRSSESSLNLGTTCASVGLGMGAGNTDVTEMASGLTLIRSSEEESVGSSRGLHNELVKSHALATGGGNTGTCRFGESMSIQIDADFKELKLMAQTMDVPTATTMPDPMQRVWLAACIAAGAPSTSLGVRPGELQKLLATGEFYMCLVDDWQGSAERLVASKSAVGYLLLGLDPVLVGAEESSLASTTA